MMAASNSGYQIVYSQPQLTTNACKFREYSSCRSGSGDTHVLLWLTILGFLLLVPGVACSQTGGSPLGQSDSQAMAIVQRSIQVLGGEAGWRLVGGATAHAVISSQLHPAQTVEWSDDWSTGRERFRRDSGKSSPASSYLIGSDALQVHQTAGGKLRDIPHDDGVAALAIGYPAAALMLSLSQYHCRFESGELVNLAIPKSTVDPDLSSVTEQCPDPFYPRSVAIMVWRFSKSTGMPKFVDLPMWGITDHVILNQTVTFGAFTTVQSLLVPSQLQIKRPSGRVDTLAISGTTFVSKLPEATFQPAN